MGRTLPAATQLILKMVPDLMPVYDALTLPQQQKLDKIFDGVVKYKAAFSNSANLLPLEIFLALAILVEHERNNKAVDAMHNRIDRLSKEESNAN